MTCRWGVVTGCAETGRTKSIVATPKAMGFHQYERGIESVPVPATVLDDVALAKRLAEPFPELLFQRGSASPNPLSEAVFLEVEFFDQTLFLQIRDVVAVATVFQVVPELVG